MHEVETFSQSIYNGWTVTDSRFGSLVDYDSKSAKVQMYPTKQKKIAQGIPLAQPHYNSYNTVLLPVTFLLQPTKIYPLQFVMWVIIIYSKQYTPLWN